VKRKSLAARPIADRDIQGAVEYYIREAGGPVALRFIDSIDHAYRQISLHPSAGSPRYAHELRIPGLRYMPLQGFPYLVFYFERDEVIDIVRILHTKRDIGPELGDLDPDHAL
jgi:toxin ParE1/3/4